MNPITRTATPLRRVHYLPIEAAIRWARLWRRELDILKVLKGRATLNEDDFPLWPRLYLCAERIYDALRNGELAYYVEGRKASKRFIADQAKITVRHVELASWMQRYYPRQRPAFLFGTPRRRLRSGITSNVPLLHECNSLMSRLVEQQRELSALLIELTASLKNSASRSRAATSGDELSTRAEMTYLHIIGGLLELLLEQDPKLNAAARFRTQEQVIAALSERDERRLGLTKSTLEAKFARARRMLSSL